MTFCMTLVNFFPFIVLINKMQKSKKLFPCGVCFKNCKTNCIECSTCLSWFHSKCLKMREEDLMTLGGDNSYFHCQNCAKTTDGKFNFELGLRRLANSVKTGEQSFFASALSEQIASRTENILEEVNDAHNTLETDNISLQILQKLGGRFMKRPIRVMGDGNCLFNSVSVALIGSESASMRLRYFTAI